MIAAELVGARPRVESVARGRALGRVLAAPVAAAVDQPPADVSAMDGYALGPGAQGTAFPATWPVVGTVAAGRPAAFAVGAGEAARIMTGAVLPHGTDRVLPVEETDGGLDAVRLDRLPPAGAQVRRCGEVVRAGEPLLAPGEPIDAATVALLATHGVAEVAVVEAPRVALLATGDEVVLPEAEPGPGRLRDSNTPFLAASLASLGLAAEPLGIAPDVEGALRERLREGLERDVLLVTGGVSMGAFDFVDELFAELGCRLVVAGVAMQPGKPLVVARSARGGWVFGLPGNPASVLVGFELFARPLLGRLLGRRDRFWGGALGGVLAAPLPAGGPRERFLPANVAVASGTLRVTPRSPRGSHDLRAWAGATGLLRVRSGADAAAAGEACEVLPLAPTSALAAAGETP